MFLLIVDGYNIVFAWEELCYFAETDISIAREKLWNILVNYCSFEGIELLLVFDAHLSRRHDASVSLKNKTKKHPKSSEIKFRQVFTKRHETADNFIEKYIRLSENSDKQMLVASSDRLIQVLVFAKAARISARELELEILKSKKKLALQTKNYLKKQNPNIEDIIDIEVYNKLDLIRKNKKQNNNKNNNNNKNK